MCIRDRLIDADNVSPKYMDLVLRETKTLGDGIPFVDAHGNSSRIPLCRLLYHLRMLHSSSANDAPGYAQLHTADHVVNGTNAATSLDKNTQLGDGANHLEVFSLAVPGPVQVYHMNMAGAL